MDRRHFLAGGAAGAMFLGPSPGPTQTPLKDNPERPDVFIERDQPGQPHKGKVLAAIQPHDDDIPIFAAGAVIKLIREGYTGILIRTSNDEAAGRGATVGEVVLNNEAPSPSSSPAQDIALSP